MNNILKIIESISATTSRNEKEKILSDNKENELLKKVLYYTYNPYMVYNISDKSLKADVDTTIDRFQFDDIFDLLDYLEVNNRSNLVINNVLLFLSENPNHATLYKNMILKDLRCGMSDKTINKVFGKNFISTFEVMLAKSYKDFSHKVVGKDFIITQKLDGQRCVMYKIGDNVKVFTRQGKPIYGLIELENDMKNMPESVVFDGELIAVNNDNLISKDLFQLTRKLASKDGNKIGLEFHCFDILPLQEFEHGKSKLSCAERKKQLYEIADSNIFSRIRIVPILYRGMDTTLIQKYLDEAIANNQEGVMINLSDAKYECKRTDKLLKVKVFNTADVRCVKVIEGTGKYENMLGAITIVFGHDNKLYKCNCGSGFSDSERIEYWEHPEMLIGQIVEVGYFEITQAEDKSYGLRFPTWKSNIRMDKDEISMN